MPGRDSILDAVAQVSSSDPYATYAPNPVYHIKETSSNNAYFSVETTEDFKAKIISNSSVPDGLYTVTVYATFGSVIDKGYTTNSNEVVLSVYI